MPSKKGSQAYNLRLQRRKYDRQINRINKQLESGVIDEALANTRIGEIQKKRAATYKNANTEVNRLSRQLQSRNLSPSIRKNYEQVLAAIKETRIDVGKITLSPSEYREMYSRLTRKLTKVERNTINNVFSNEINAALRGERNRIRQKQEGESVSLPSSFLNANDVHAFFKYTQHYWINADHEKRYEAILRNGNYDTILEAYESVMNAHKQDIKDEYVLTHPDEFSEEEVLESQDRLYSHDNSDEYTISSSVNVERPTSFQ